MNISDFSVHKPITMLMVLLSIIVLGLLALQRLPLAFMPDFTSDHIHISVPYASSSPEEVERLITRPIEEIMSTLSHLETINSTSSANEASIGLEFTDGVNMGLVSVAVRDRIDRVRPLLPDDVERIRIRKWQSTSFPIIQFSLAWDGPKDELYELTNKVIVPRIQRIDGVANVDIGGLDERQVLINLDLERLRAHHIDVYDLSSSLRTNNVNISGGWVINADHKYTVRTMGEFRNLDEIAQVPIQGTHLVLGDVADVKFGYPEKMNFERLNSNEAIVLRIYKSSTANVVDVATEVKKYIESLRGEPNHKDLNVLIVRDQSEEILNSLRNLAMAGIFGAVLATVVLYIFLRKFRSTIIIAMAIPISIITTFFLMYILRLAPFNTNITLNIVSLSGLMFAVGMLVDPAVVVLENIFRHKQEEGLPAFQAAIVGAREVSVAVTSATLTTIIVFVPLVFMADSDMGRWSRDFGIAIVTATVASLLISLTMIPLASSRIFTGKEKPTSRFLVRMGESYGRGISRLIRYRFPALVACLLIGWGAWSLYNNIDRDWVPRTPERRMDINLELPRGYTVQKIEALYDTLETILLSKRQSLEISQISSQYRKHPGHFHAELTVYFISEEEGQKSTTELYNDVRAVLPPYPGVEYRVGRMRGRGGNDMGIEVQLHGKNSAILAVYAEEVKNLLKDIPGIKDIDTSMERGDEEMRISVDRVRAQRYNLSARQVARSVSSALSSRSNSRFKTQDKELNILMQLAEEDRLNRQQLENMAIRSSDNEMVQLGSVASFTPQRGIEAIERQDRQTTLSVFANTESGGLQKVSEEISARMATIKLPPGYSWGLGRNWLLMQQMESESNFAIILALILVYIVMASLFESFVHPFTILLTVPFAFIGVLLMFWATNTNLNNMAYLGIIVVCGLVVNNGIILIDAINKLRRSGKTRTEAIRLGGRNRLRPILMTTLTTVIGLLPLALPAMFPAFFGPQEGRTAMYAPVGLALVGGLLTSTPLTLFLMPIVYVILDDVAAWFMKIVSFTRAMNAEKVEQEVVV
ncbi:efflux RND transporter permease subunit [candidate division KSB1 bacterium]|nr:efflux RND transporter permease subunit [candidate division KSB1 bacterium]